MALPNKTHFQRVGGQQWVDSFYRFNLPVGDVRYVHASGTATGPGFSPETAYSTLQAAHDASTASNGDHIVIMPGHTETIVGAAGTAVSKAGLNIIGLGTGRNRPVFTFTTAAAASFDITAANTLIQNIVLVNGINAQTAMVNVTAADVVFDGCEFAIDNGTTISTLLGILTAATATRLVVRNSRFLGTAAATTAVTACIQHESGTDALIEGNYFSGKMTQAILNVATVLRGNINNNRFVIGTGTVAITMAAASTPFITNNRIMVASGTAPIVAAAGFVAGNVYAAAAGVTAGTASTF